MTAGRMVSLGLPIVALTAAGCADMSGQSYDLDRGPASYDALKTATEACRSRGGELRLRKEYGGLDLSDYQCAIGKAR